jgi:hypothetical protein
MRDLLAQGPGVVREAEAVELLCYQKKRIGAFAATFISGKSKFAIS